ncbi:hypothetical protein C1H46_025479 [Malus baccata]|uniref:FBD domain-containing protein n=1 Tax=Malus baccata TaxID=106549 RepID=A0A540LRT1_MALBA|nr:hypothetical protein C1H46_025479 [Malus baccata]
MRQAVSEPYFSCSVPLPSAPTREIPADPDPAPVLHRLLGTEPSLDQLPSSSSSKPFELARAYTSVRSSYTKTKRNQAPWNTNALIWKGSMPGLLAHVGHFCVRDMSLTDHLVKESGKFGSKYWKLKNLACINQLKEVTFEISNNGMNEWELARYIIENAKNLKKLFIYYLPNQFTLFREITESATNSPATVEFKVYDKSRRVYNDDLISPDVQQKTN